MVEFIKGKLLAALLLALVGSVLLVIGGILGISLPEMEPILEEEPILFMTFILPIILGLIGIAGAALTIIEKNDLNYIIIIVGLIAVIGIFIPLIDEYPLVMTLLYIDPFLILIGGILSVVINE
ncbi:MAG: hypothetical protein ACFE94_08940 [Candidatus Hodarchaeota archaeon]